MTWGEYLFSFKGRINRARYWQFIILFWLFVVAAFAASTVFVVGATKKNELGASAIVIGLVAFVGFLFFLYAHMAIATKRLHDRDKRGWWILLFIGVPVLLDILDLGAPGLRLLGAPFSIWGFVEIGCLRGTDGDNRFGPDPLSEPSQEAARVFT